MNNNFFTNTAIPIVLALAAFFMSYLAITGNAAFWWDEADYGLLARGVMDGFFGAYGTSSLRPPMLPIYGAIFKALIGDLTWTFLIPLFSSLSVASMYLIGRKLFDWRAGLISSIIMLFSTQFVFNSGRFLTEVPGMFFSGLSIYFMYQCFESGRKRDFILFMLTTLCAFLIFFRFLMVVAALGLFAIAFRYKKIGQYWKEIGVLSLIGLVLLLPLLLYSNTYYLGPLGIFTMAFGGQTIVEPLEYFIFYNNSWTIFFIFSDPSVVLLILLGLAYAVFFGNKAHKYLAAMTLLIFILASVLLNHKEPRYLMPIFPAAFLLIGGFCSGVIGGAIDALKTFSSSGLKMETLAIRIVAGLIVLPLLFQGSFGNYSNAMSVYTQSKNSYGDFRVAAQYIKEISSPADLLMTDSVTAMFHSDRKTVGFPADKTDVFLQWLDRDKPAYLLISRQESGMYYENALVNFKNLKEPSNSVEYVLLHPEKFQLIKVFPNDQTPLILAFKVNW